MEEDTRNLVDEYKGLSNEEVFQKLDEKRNELEIAIENVSHDFNAKKVHIVGRRKYNRRGAMCTDKYLEICYWSSIDEFISDQKKRGREVVAIENNVSGCKPLSLKDFLEKTTLLFGGESDGLTSEILEKVDDVRFIESFGSTRSVNVGVASGIAMYEWARQNAISA